MLLVDCITLLRERSAGNYVNILSVQKSFLSLPFFKKAQFDLWQTIFVKLTDPRRLYALVFDVPTC